LLLLLLCFEFMPAKREKFQMEETISECCNYRFYYCCSFADGKIWHNKKNYTHTHIIKTTKKIAINVAMLQAGLQKRICRKHAHTGKLRAQQQSDKSDIQKYHLGITHIGNWQISKIDN